MKRIISILLFATILFGFNACKKDETSGKISINFINKTGLKINNAVVDNIQLGSIENNGETGFRTFEKFGTDTQMPDCNFTGIQSTDTLKSTSVFYWCGTEKRLLKAGEYNIEVRLYTYGTTKYFDLQFK